jgi:hypothetical protein
LNTKRIALAALLMSFAVLRVAAAEDCDPKGQKVDQVMGSKVAAYDQAGNFIEDLPKSAIVIGADILECRNSPALVKIRLADQRSVWVDRLEVKVSGGKAPAPRTCKNAPISRRSDTTTPATSGIDPCSN